MIALMLSCLLQGPAEIRTISIPFPGRLEYALNRDIDGDGRDDLILVGTRRVSPDRLERLIRVHTAGEGAPNPERFGETIAADTWAAICWSDWISLPGLELLAITPAGVVVHPLDPDAPRERPSWHPQGRTLFAGRTYFDRADARHLPRWYLHGDWDDDGKPELLVPLPRGYLHLAWARGARATAHGTIDLSEHMAAHRIYDSSPFAVERRLPIPTICDIDGDSVRDLVYEDARSRRLIEHRGERGKAGGLHFGSAQRVDTSSKRGAAAGDSRVQKSFRRLVDLDGNGRLDLLSWRIFGDLSGGMRFETVVAIARGHPGGTLGFDPPREMRFRGVASVPATPDLNGDGRRDLLIIRAEGVLAAALTGRATVRYAVYLQRPTGGYANQPSFEFSHRIPTSELTEEDLRLGRLPAAADPTADLDGDGTPDLLLIQPDESIEIRRGRLERRSHEGHTWDMLRFEEKPWISLRCRASYRFGHAIFGPSFGAALYFLRSDSVLVILLP